MVAKEVANWVNLGKKEKVDYKKLRTIIINEKREDHEEVKEIDEDH